MGQTCLEFASRRKQLEMLVLLLCAINANLEESSCDLKASLAAAANLTCLSPADLKARAAQAICVNLDVDCKALACLTPGQLAALENYLVTQILDNLNPPIL